MPPGHYLPQPPILRQEDFEKNPARSQYLVQQYLERLNSMARSLSFLDNDGGVATGRRCLNIDAVWVRYVSNGVANTEDTVAHNLGRTPQGMWVSAPDKAAVIYRGTTAWTTTNVFLKSDVATTTVDVLLF